MVTIWKQNVTISSFLLLRRNCVLFCSCIFKKISLFFSHLRGVEQQADNEHAAAISEDRIDNADEVAEADAARGVAQRSQRENEPSALLLLIAYSVLLAVMAVPETADAELPMLALAYGLSRPLGYVYGILLLLCMYGSALSMTVAITTYASARSERVEKRRGWFILALGALGYAASSVGFGDLISVVYPVFGYCSSVFIVCLLLHAAQVRKKERNFFENAGTKEDTISS